MTDIEQKRREIAVMMGLSPGHEETWPVETIDNLLALHEHRGREAVIREIAVLMGSSRPPR